jgi:hypothetical protein
MRTGFSAKSRDDAAVVDFVCGKFGRNYHQPPRPGTSGFPPMTMAGRRGQIFMHMSALMRADEKKEHFCDIKCR